MAQSGQYEQKVVDKVFKMNEVHLGFSWTRTDYSIANNTSTIYWQVYIKLGSNFKTMTFNNTPIMVTIDGSQKTYVFNNTVNNLGEPITIASDYTTINHNSNGHKTFPFYVVVDDGNLSWTLSNIGELDVIPRPAKITSATDFNDEGNPVITYTNISGGLVDSLQAAIYLPDGQTVLASYREIDKHETSYTFKLTLKERITLMKAVTSKNSMPIRFYITTTIGDYTEWSYLTKTFTLINHEPTLAPTVVDTNPDTTILTGDVNKLVRYYSNAFITFGAVVRKEATVVRKTATNGSQSINIEDANNQDTIVINGIDDNVFTLDLVDSRGYTISEQVHFKGDNFIPYTKVTCNQSALLNMDKTVVLTIKGNYFNDSFGAANNELIIETRHRESGGEWSAWGNITPLISDISNNTYTLSATISGYDPSGTYEFQSRARDKLSIAESAVDTITLEPLFDWGKYDFNFNVPVSIKGEPISDFVIETGVENMGSNGTWYWRKWKNGRAECYGCRNYGNMAVTTGWGGLFRSETFVQDLPSGLFVATPEVIDISLRSTGNYGGWVVRHEESAPSDYDSGSFIVVRPASATLQQTYISFNIIGRWK